MKQLMKDFIEQNCILRGNFVLSSGKKSNIYFDLRKATLNGYFLNLLDCYFHDDIMPKVDEFNIIGGPSIGADFLTASLIKGISGYYLFPFGSIVRPPKKHGTKLTIEGLIKEGDRKILVVDDVLTTGKSIEKACDAFLEVNYDIKGIFVILNRGTQAIINRLKEKYKVPFLSIFEEKDFENYL